MRDAAKIKALIAAMIAKGKASEHEAEADTFLRRAAELLEEHQLSLGEIFDQDDPVIFRTGLSQAQGSHIWRRDLFAATGALYGCQSVIHTTWNAVKHRLDQSVELCGRESAIVTAELMFPYLVEQVRVEAKRLAPITGMSEQGQAKRIGAALIVRVWKLVRLREAKPPATEAARKNALVTVDAVKAAVEGQYGELDEATARKKVTDRLSREAAGNINLALQVGDTSQLMLEAKS